MQFRRGKSSKDETGCYRAVWYIGGKRYRERTHFTNEYDVEKYLQNKEQMYYRYRGTWVGKEVKISVRDAAEQFIDSRSNHSKSTRRQYRWVLGNFVSFPSIEGRMVGSISNADVNEFLNAHSRSGVTTATQNADLRVLRAFGNWCKEQGLIAWSFAEGIKSRQEPRKRKKYLNMNQLSAFFEACTPTFRPIAKLAITTGLRKKEICNLKWSEVELDDSGGGIIWPQRAKTEADDRPIPLHKDIVSELNKLERISSYVFPLTKDTYNPKTNEIMLKGSRRSEETNWFWRSVRRAALKSGINPLRINMHGLRKTFGNAVQQLGGDINLTSNLLGHHDIGTTRNHYLGTDIVKANNVINSIPLKPTSLEEPENDGPVADARSAGTGGAEIIDITRFIRTDGNTAPDLPQKRGK